MRQILAHNFHICVVYNIDLRYNDSLLENSVVLLGYTTFVEKVRKYQDEEISLERAVNRAIDERVEEVSR